MGQSLGIGDIVDADDLEPAVSHGGLEHQASYTTEPIDTDLDSHSTSHVVLSDEK